MFGGEKVKVKYANFDEELMQPQPQPTTQENAYQQYWKEKASTSNDNNILSSHLDVNFLVM